MSASASIVDIQRMLDTCAPGYGIRRTTHGRCVSYGTKVFRDLPKFDDIELGHIRKMARHLGIYECAKKFGII